MKSTQVVVRRSKSIQHAATALWALTLIAIAPMAHAGGFDRVNTVFNNINTTLIGAGVAIMTMALLWCGYKVLFRGASFEDISKPMIGGIILGAAPTLAGFLLG